MSKTILLKMKNKEKVDGCDSQLRKGIIWKVDRNAIHDGPGIRTLAYFKGCPLRCLWCHNPEGQIGGPVLVFQRMKCNGCGLCIEACPTRALELRSPVNVIIDRSKCDVCGACVSICPTEALQIWGQSYTVQDLIEILEKDRMIHRKSAGGLTCTGGEPLEQGEFLLEILEECQKRGIHTAVETSAYADEKLFLRMLKKVGWLFIDLKHMNTKKNLELTGKNNDIILNNTRIASSTLQARGKSLIIRQIIVPGITDGQNLSELADFVASLPFVSGVELLMYHNYGSHKYKLLHRKYGLQEMTSPTDEEMEKHKKVLRDKGLTII
jgi:pyruvate formate lyase activating enzyme